MNRQLENKRALVTGGSRGIGAAIVTRLAREGAHVALTYVSKPDRSNEMVQMAQALGVNQSRISEYEQGGLRLHGAVVVALAKTLRVSADELLGLDKTEARGPKNARLLRRLQRIEDLPASERRAVLKILDSLLQRHAGNGRR